MSDELAEYLFKRAPDRTPEPTHCDLRLVADGVLESWAAPKGPSTDPGEQCLAVRRVDHSLDYADFEGVISEGEYGTDKDPAGVVRERPA